MSENQPLQLEMTQSMFRQLTDTAAMDRPRLSEHEFVEHLLPHLVRNIDAEDGSNEVDLTIWLAVAGNPHRWIDVVDQTNTLLFSVPPPLARLNTTAPSLTPREGPSASDIVKIYGEKRLIHPGAGDAFLNFALASEAKISLEQEEQLRCLDAWITIYKRYNLPTEKLFGGVKIDEAKADKAATAAAEDALAQVSGELDDFD